MNRSIIRPSMLRAGLLASVVVLSGCSAGYTTNNASSVLLIVAGVNGGSPLRSDVLFKGGIVTDSVSVAVAIRFKNPGVTAPSVPNAVILERYEVRYRRSDGKGVEGQDVPFTISGNITAAFDVKTSGTDPISIEVVRAQAKFEPPLRNLQGNFGGGVVVTMFADITLHGRTVSGQAVSGSGTLQVDFADWADEA